MSTTQNASTVSFLSSPIEYINQNVYTIDKNGNRKYNLLKDNPGDDEAFEKTADFIFRISGTRVRILPKDFIKMPTVF